MSHLGNKGFTLIELITFIIIGAIFIPASMLAFTSVMSNFATPDREVTARFLVEKKMEELTKDAFDSVATNAQPYAAVPGYTGYRWMWTICNTRSSEMNLSCSAAHTGGGDYGFYKRIEVTVLMPGNTTYDANTLISKRPRS